MSGFASRTSATLPNEINHVTEAATGERSFLHLKPHRPQTHPESTQAALD
jgi:hypothetical protein